MDSKEYGKPAHHLFHSASLKVTEACQVGCEAQLHRLAPAWKPAVDGNCSELHGGRLWKQCYN